MIYKKNPFSVLLHTGNLTENIQKAVTFTSLIVAALNVVKAISSGVQGLWLSFRMCFRSFIPVPFLLVMARVNLSS